MSTARTIFFCASVLLLVAMQTDAHAQRSCVDEVYSKYAVDGQLSLTALKAHQSEFNVCEAEKKARFRALAEGQAARRAAIVTAVTAVTTPPPPIKNGEVVVDPKTKTATSIYFFLRKDFADLHLFSQPSPLDEADGAMFAYAHDRLARNTIWSAQGMAGFVWKQFSRSRVGLAEDGLIAVSFAPYLEFDVSKNSSSGQRGNDRENYNVGLVTESAIRTGPAVHYLRLSGGEAFDNIENKNTPTAVFEWIPAYQLGPSRAIGLITTAGGPLDPFIRLPYPVAYRFTPSFKARYDNIPVADGSLDRRDEFRVGAQATLYLGFISGTAPDILQRLSSNTTYSWLQSTHSNRSFEWLQTSLSYRLDEQGYIGLTGTYKKGRVEQTTKKTDEYLVGLSAKW